MFKIGDHIVYSVHGICEIDDIMEITVGGVTKLHYKMHPLENGHRMTITTPVDNDKVAILALLTKEQAAEIIESFKLPGIEWMEDAHARSAHYNNIVHGGDRREIAKVINTLKRTMTELKEDSQRLHERDQKLLNTTQAILFRELALALKKPYTEISEIVSDSIASQLQVA